MKKIIYFLAGMCFVPFILGTITTFIARKDEYDAYIGFWGTAYVLIYLFFPIMYRGKVARKIPNKCVFYAVVYAIAGIVLAMLHLW